jgi:dUTP pyrophosphatase
MENLSVVLLHKDAVVPKRATPGSVGYDLVSIEDKVLYPDTWELFRTGLRIRVPLGTYGRIAPRSGLAVKHHVDVKAGVIDFDYRGEVMILLSAGPGTGVRIAKGDKIAQLILENVTTTKVEVVATLDETERGSGGFGSTDRKQYRMY